MRVHSCTVDDGAGDRIDLIDENGFLTWILTRNLLCRRFIIHCYSPFSCALDRYLLGNLEYVTDLMAGKEAHVFKYADRANLYFDCQIMITVKEPDQVCPVS